MDQTVVFGIINNGALLLALTFVYDVIVTKDRQWRNIPRAMITGAILGLISIAVMYSPIKWAPGVIFDTRTVLLCLTGLFFGPIETVVAVLLSGAYRLSLGGSGMPMGVATIVSAGLIGQLWRGLRKRSVSKYSLTEIYLLGLVVHFSMVLCMFLLPSELVYPTMRKLALPIVLIYPLVTTMLGAMLLGRADRRKYEATLKEERDRFQAFLDASPSAIYIKDLESRFILFNKAFEVMFGVDSETRATFSTEELHGDNENVSKFLAQDRKVMETGQTVIMDTKVPCADTYLHDHLIIKFPIKDSEGAIVAIGGINLDVTVEKEALRQVEEERERLGISLRAARMGIFSYNVDRQSWKLDDQASRLLGVAPSSFSGSTEELTSSIHVGDRQNILSAVEKTLASKGPCSCEYRVLWPDGTTHFIAARGQIHLDDDGDPVEIRGVFWDETEKKVAQLERDGLIARLHQAQKMEAIGTLAGGIAHDFNNILGAILGFTELTLSSLEQGSEERENLQEVVVASHRARDLVQQILAFSRKNEKKLVPVETHRVVAEAVKLLRAIIPSTIAIEHHIDQSVGYVLADPTELHQIIMNLCTNAYHAMEEKGGVLHLNLSGTTVGPVDASALPSLVAGEYIRIEVDDNGCGMDEETVSRIFEPYFTTKEIGKGTGLGLATVHGIITELRGAITVRSRPGVGTTFTVYLPKFVVRELVASEAQVSPEQSGQGMVLLVDDETALARLGKKMLESIGYRVRIATDPLEALSLFESDPAGFDIIVTDQTMPGLTGMELIRRAKAIRPEIAAVICTGYSDAIDEEGLERLGIGSYVKKPYDRKRLGEAVAGALPPQGGRSGEAPEGSRRLIY